MSYITSDLDEIRIGGSTTLRDLSRSSLLRGELPVLAQAVALVGNHRVRGAATLGGNLAEADHSSDPPPVLVGLDARVRLRSERGDRVVPVADLVTGYYETVIAQDELLVEIIIPRPSRSACSVYLKFTTRTTDDRPCLGIMCLVDRDGNDLTDARVVVGGGTPSPFRLVDEEERLVGQSIQSDAVRGLAAAYAASFVPVSDLRGSSAYRKRVVDPLIRRAVRMAADGIEVAKRV
jgi:carbon-monoxide dehydrogenase medium subunit